MNALTPGSFTAKMFIDFCCRGSVEAIKSPNLPQMNEYPHH